MEEIKLIDIYQQLQPEVILERRNRKANAPQRAKYFNQELVNNVYVKERPLQTLPSQSTSNLSRVERKDTEPYYYPSPDQMNREVYLKCLMSKPMLFKDYNPNRSPYQKKNKGSSKVSSMIQLTSLSRFSSNPSIDSQFSPLSTDPINFIKKSKQNETYLPKVLQTNSTYNDMPSVNDMHPLQSQNSLNRDADSTQTVSAAPAASQPNLTYFGEDSFKQVKSQSSTQSSSILNRKSQSLKRIKDLPMQKSKKKLSIFPSLVDNLSMTKRQQTLITSKANQNDYHTQKNSFTINQSISPNLETEINLPRDESINQSNIINSSRITDNFQSRNNDSKKYTKYAQYINIPPQNEMRKEIWNMLSVKSAQSISAQPQQQTKRIETFKKIGAAPQAQAKQVPQKPKVDTHMIEVRKSIKQKFKRAKLRLRILLGFFNKLRKATSKRREFFLKEMQTGVLTKETIIDIMVLSMKVTKESLLMLFEEESTLDYYNYVADRKKFILRRQRLRQFSFNIISDYIESSCKMMDTSSSFIKFVSLHTRNYSHVADNFWPAFILERLEFTNYGQIKNVTQSQREMISIYLYFVFGICNRLVRPWKTLNIQESYVKEKNAQLVLSLVFYIMMDYIKENNPVQENSFHSIPEQYKPKLRSSPLNSYNDVLQKDRLFQVDVKKNQIESYNLTVPDFEKIEKEFEDQKTLNENIIIGLHPRKHLEDLISGDEQMKKSIYTCFKKGAVLLLSKVYSFNLNLNSNLFSFLD